MALKRSEIRFRYYRGEEENPYKQCRTREEQSKCRWWDQESHAMRELKLLREDLARRHDEDMPDALRYSTLPDEEISAILTGFLDTKQWGDAAYDFEGYFDAPLNDFRLPDREEEEREEEA